jgi:hypothetical protein
LTAFYPEQIQGSAFIPPVVVTDFQLANQPVEIGDNSILQQAIPETEQLTLSHQDRVISFEFAALDYRAPGKNRYRYTLEGFDEDWTEVGSDRRRVTYTNLDPGEYTFRVLGSNSDGVWNEGGTSTHHHAALVGYDLVQRAVSGRGGCRCLRRLPVAGEIPGSPKPRA